MSDTPTTGNTANISISMSPYQWGRLLKDFDDHLRICNRDGSATVEFYEIIATAINGGKPVRVIHPDNPDPKYRPAPPVPPKASTDSIAPKKGFWYKLSHFWANE